MINGALINAVLAASVAPFGGDGSLPPPPAYGVAPQDAGTPPGYFTNYQAPAGMTDNNAELLNPQRHQWCAHGTCGLGSAYRQPA